MILRYIERIRNTFPVDINTYCKEYNQHNMGLEKKDDKETTERKN